MPEDEKQPLFAHLSELRKRLLICVVGIVIGLIVSYVFYDSVILNVVRSPIDALSGNPDNPFVFENPLLRLFRLKLENPELTLHYIGPLEAFGVKLRLSLMCGIILALPLVLYQLWRFVSLGLKGKERRLSRSFLPISILLFFAGIAFSYFIVVPVGLYFLINVSGSLVPIFTISKYASMVLILTMAFGLIFEMPLVVLFITRVGIITPQALAKKRKYAILVMFVLAAMLTPPDVFTQLMLAVPVLILFEFSILIAKAASRRKKKRRAED